eukprot:3941160-Rhodomonas_salina.1
MSQARSEFPVAQRVPALNAAAVSADLHARTGMRRTAASLPLPTPEVDFGVRGSNPTSFVPAADRTRLEKL